MGTNADLGHYDAGGNSIHNKKIKNKENRKLKGEGRKHESEPMPDAQETDLLKVLLDDEDEDDKDANMGTNSPTVDTDGEGTDIDDTDDENQENVDSNAAKGDDEETDKDDTTVDTNGEETDIDDTDDENLENVDSNAVDANADTDPANIEGAGNPEEEEDE